MQLSAKEGGGSTADDAYQTIAGELGCFSADDRPQIEEWRGKGGALRTPLPLGRQKVNRHKKTPCDDEHVQ